MTSTLDHRATSGRFVDLTRTLVAGMPVPEGPPAPERVDLYDGHFHRGMALIDDIPVDEFVLPGCVIDMSGRAAAGTSHYPGWSKEALVYLVDVRRIRAIGHETPDTDSGATATAGPVPWPLESYFLGTGRWQVENLTNLDRLPARGFTVVVGVAQIGAGASFPTRVFAILP